ncbi:hypothetical protein CcaverHIS002_0605580 [Cutaneotrichosporon cavernicola]|uniref:Uncharacterized protein n=1 Tax=Cutaneotrichosporon cavernicola TaxID=279322 RepID=A0AA48L8U6_9TREE|nr:uncharacterized protein CcaverHIS019_0605040 [Cutaneotrichosporon cavernicola]BEI86271.1 hypothetical protein CcaverHIS002_0605580 [Cutaneotrichosporon cavernicola]BEI94045.1 hypothetical protein CcaverHIS019_0605040 [Cutaneotrichosporon cavernicola]BEJ01824.1 hypothetical protein CcaverHIS631_0605060 [Cutaneotrichosporon cavernicola]BEJ09589.1 hypothetical protein CcaverHIS641_0605040 [Cutaneotrichosporon cavernicola]
MNLLIITIFITTLVFVSALPLDYRIHVHGRSDSGSSGSSGSSGTALVENRGNESARPTDWKNTWESGDWDDGPLSDYPPWEGVPFTFEGDWESPKGTRAQIALLDYMIGVAERLDLKDLVQIWNGEVRRLNTRLAELDVKPEVVEHGDSGR